MTRLRKALVLLGLVAVLALTGAVPYPTVTLEINGKEIKPDVPPLIVEGRTLVPVRAISEGLGAKVTWDARTRTVRVVSSKNDRPPVRSQILEAVVQAISPKSAVELWAEGVFSCDATLQYAAMSSELKMANETAFRNSGWVTGYPGGWAESYEVIEDASEETLYRPFTVRFTGTASGQPSAQEVKITATKRLLFDSAVRWSVSKIEYQGAGIIPFVLRQMSPSTDDPTMHQEDWLAAAWDTSTGSVKILPTRVTRMKTKGTQVSWDGGNKINLVPETRGSVIILEESQMDYFLKSLPSPDRPATPCTGWVIEDGKHVPAIVYGNADLVIFGAKQSKTISMELPNDRGRTIVRPIGVGGTFDEPRVYYEMFISEPAPGHNALIEITSTSRGFLVRNVCEDLAVFEAGAGTFMTLASDRVYIGTQDGRVKFVELSNGAVTDWSEVNRALESFRQTYAKSVEYAMPPAVRLYGNVVTVVWTPPALKTVTDALGSHEQISPVSVFLATSGGQVVSELRIVDNSIAVTKKGIVTGQIAIPGVGQVEPLLPSD